MFRRKLSRQLLVAAVGVFVLVATAGVAYATITAPTQNPFSVPDNPAGSGNPAPFTISANGFTGVPFVFVEQCDGVPSTTTGWNPNVDCDSGTSPAKKAPDGSGAVTFPFDDQNYQFIPIKGELSNFNCLAPGDPASNNGKPDYTNCQVRVSSNNSAVTSDQQFFTMTLPSAQSGTSSSSASTTSTTIVGGNATCHMGDGLPGKPGAPPKNAGLVKISKGLTSTAAAKDTKLKFTGTLENCTGFPTAPKTGTPITAGSISMQVEVPPGSTCSTLVPGAPVKTSLQIKWSALSKGKLKTVATDKTAVASYSRNGNGIPIELDATGAAFTNPKSMFMGKHVSLSFLMDETQSAINTACAAKTGLAALHFTGAQGASTLTLSS